ncbi:GATM [Mytilus edulis]|uniref:GATM n=1 Tax=Mytilus edulis TaxID=6550 RepID=A0A8S3V5T8_MYTED|nr:GATM [Mytilus edulis]
MKIVNSHNEWDPLEEIILGVPDFWCTPQKEPGYLPTSRVKCGVNEKKAWYATNFSDEKTIFDLYNEFASGNLDNKSPVNEIQNSRITAHIGTKKISQQYRTECSASKKVFQGDKERWEYLAPVSNINPTKQARYNLLHTAIIHSDFFAPIVVNDYSPGEPNRRYDYFKGLIVPVKCCQFTYTGSKEHLMFLWKVQWVSESDLLTKNMQIACNLRKSLPVYHSRAMRREFLSLFGRTISNKSAFLREAYRRLTGDQSASLTASQTEVDRRISEILDNEDSELICDLRLNNRGQPEKYNEFLSECQNYINEKLELAVDDRRHDKIDKGVSVLPRIFG